MCKMFLKYNMDGTVGRPVLSTFRLIPVNKLCLQRRGLSSPSLGEGDKGGVNLFLTSSLNSSSELLCLADSTSPLGKRRLRDRSVSH